ncbi:MAG: sulfotransferase family protein [Planctomycetaceae bacterium]|nr:sulfotransferase family protein [Planctomycetaceae bacterium]
MSLQVIGAGFGRTGTLSLKMALEELGFGPCYHMVELFNDRGRITHWENARLGRPVDWDALFDGYQSAVDFPVCSYYKELAERYPEAKFILTERDVDSWYASASQTILNVKPSLLQSFWIMLRLPFSQDARNLARIGMHNHAIVNQRMPDEATAKRVYLEHNQAVRETIPADRLLIYQVKEGWEPLCQFLKVPVPTSVFPKSNSREGFPEMVKKHLW